MVSHAVLGSCNLKILQKQNAAIWLADKQICIHFTQYYTLLLPENFVTILLAQESHFYVYKLFKEI